MRLSLFDPSSQTLVNVCIVVARLGALFFSCLGALFFSCLGGVSSCLGGLSTRLGGVSSSVV
jgi:hypothetical protein